MIKIGNVLAIFIVIFLVGVNVCAENYSISSIDLVQNLQGDIVYISDYTITDDCGEKNVSVRFNLTNNTLLQQNPLVMAVLSRQGVLEDLIVEEVVLQPGTQQEKTITINVPDGEEYSIKTMVWKSFSDMLPIGLAKTINLDIYGKTRDLIVNTVSNTEFKVHLNSFNLKGSDVSSKHRITYNPEKMIPVDLCGFTYEKELSTGHIADTYITIEKADFENGILEYSLNYPFGKITGTNNVIVFKSLNDLQNEEITYTIW